RARARGRGAPVDIIHSLWDCTLEPAEGGRWALRLGFRQIKGFAEAAAEQLIGARPEHGYLDARALWRRSGLGRGALERLAEADAFRSIGLDRRRALWALKASGDPPLPLFAAAADEASVPTSVLPSEAAAWRHSAAQDSE